MAARRPLLNNNLNIRLVHTSTSTVYTTVYTTATMYNMDRTCIAYTLVKDAAAAASVCRKRRDVADIADLLGVDAISPSQVAP